MGAMQRIRTGPIAFECRTQIGETFVDERPPAHCPAAARRLGDCLSHFDPRTPALRRRRARAMPPGLAPTAPRTAAAASRRAAAAAAATNTAWGPARWSPTAVTLSGID